MAEYLVHGEDLTSVAEAIRQKGGTTEPLQFPDGFVSAVEAIETGAAEDKMKQYIAGQLTELVDSSITTIGQWFLFYRDSLMTKVELPNAVGECKNGAFYTASALKECYLPQITSLGSTCFYSCPELVDTDFSAVEIIGQDCFQGCTKLARLDFPAVTQIKVANNFRNCSKLDTLILRSSTMVTLESSTAFTNTPIASGTGYIYVPGDLISTYQADSVWATYGDQFRAIEDYPDV